MISSSSSRKLPQFDYIIFSCYLALVGIGLMMVYATNYHDYGGDSIWSIGSPFGRQLIWAGVSILALFLTYALFDWQTLNSLSLPIYLIGLIILIVLLIIGTEINGAKSWISIGGISIQPSEFAKVSTIIYLSSILNAIRFNLKEIKTQLFVIAVIAAPSFLVLLQPDAGSALTFFSLFILLYRRGMPTSYFIVGIVLFLTVIISLIYGFWVTGTILFLSSAIFIFDFDQRRWAEIMTFIILVLSSLLAYQFGYIRYAFGGNLLLITILILFFNRRRLLPEKVKFLSVIFGLCVISVASSYSFTRVLPAHQVDRINAWLQPGKCDPQGSLYNVLQSKLAIGSGGLTGKGFLEGTFTKLNYVPEQSTDFIFSSIGEEQGFLGSFSVVAIFIIMLTRLLYQGEESKHLFVKNYSYAVAGFIFIHFFINIGMTMGMAPVIGIPLPFISKGGSALIAFSIMVGAALRMYRSR